LFRLYPPVTREKATVALHFRRIRTRLGVVQHFQVFWLLKTLSIDNHRKAPYPWTQQGVRRGWVLNKDNSITTKMAL